MATKTFIGIDNTLVSSGETVLFSSGYYDHGLGGGSIVNVTYQQLTGLTVTSGLTAGTLYLLTDYQTVHYFLDGSTALSQINTGATIEPLLLLGVSSGTLSNFAQSPLYPQDIIHYDWTGGDNRDISFFSGATPVPGLKGIITYRKDSVQNISCYYDWRQVKFLRWGVNVDYWDINSGYTANTVARQGFIIYKVAETILSGSTNPALNTRYWYPWLDLSNTSDWSWTSNKLNLLCGNVNVTGSSLSLTNPVEYNTFGDYASQVQDMSIGFNVYDVLQPTRLNNIVFLSTNGFGGPNCMGVNIKNGRNSTLYGFQWYDTYGSNFYNNLLNQYCHYNTIGNNFYQNAGYGAINHNQLGNTCYANTINTFSDNKIGYSCHHNNLAKFQSNTILGSFYNNNFQSSTGFAQHINNNLGYNFNFNTIGSNFQGNDIGNNFAINLIGQGFQVNTIGYLVNNNTFEDDFQSNILDNNLQYCTISGECKFNNFGPNYRLNLGNNFQYNTLGNNITTSGAILYFPANVVNNYFHHQCFAYSISNRYLSGVTHLVQDYNCDVLLGGTGTTILTYWDEKAVLHSTIIDV